MKRLAAAATAIAAVVAPATADARVNRWDVVAPVVDKLDRIAACETRGRAWPWTAVSPGGQYMGGLQFDQQTWASVGGHGSPHRASRMEQRYRGALLMGHRGVAPWPVCGAA